MDTRTGLIVAEYRRVRQQLLEAFPELAEDADALSDTLEGETQLPDAIARLVRSALHDEAMADALGSIMKDQGERKSRLASRASKRREAAMALLQFLERRKLEMPDFTASIRAVPPKVEITDEAALPDEVFKIVRSPDKAAIKEALGKGPVPGATLSNGGETLSVRVK